ncbi:asparagine synthase (glutamine-hydrolyzing) [Clostridioides sp. ZZV15-6383]|uniref:asparagine synthase (glutamine-hydrolyzing) n=1 Tax=unclassified Clostridioides TaxID=2635829 RepID=UPI001D11E3DB|nr:asparagine synthase (glutamine-hydrolyzing) [Clostridioides sp. ZZV14-6345]MCC0700284.1 asparagine synthase (glutamine-hydrolyzing) [Clostridioides sp. ZZV15-6383]
MINLEEKYSTRKDTHTIKILEYSGHIRNWKVLCEELGIDSSLSREEREREILVKAYKTWRDDMANHIHGMFAFALWDDEERKLFCLRDQFGAKPFYYYETANGELLYGSSIRKIMEQPGFVKELNEEMLQIYMTFTYVAGENTFFHGLRKLMPGHYLVWQGRTVSIERYWKPEFHPDYSKSLKEWSNEIHTTFQTIMLEVKSEDETAGLFLSGGVDSSYILAMSDTETTDSCGYEEEWFDESKLANQTANILGRRNSRHIITPEEYFSTVPYVMYHMEQPIGDASAIVFAIGCKAVAKRTKICYSGEGADEFFGGYNVYHKAECYGENLNTFYIGNTNIMNEDEKQKILKKYNPDVLPIELVKRIYEETEELDAFTNMSNVDIQIWLEGDIYLNVDKMSTAVGLEIRMPLTDTRIFDIASRMPSEYKVKEEQNKIAFRTAAKKVLPEEIAFRNKLGFIVPIRVWMADEKYNQDIRDKFNSEMAEKFFNIDEINAIFDDYIAGNSDNWRKIWTIYTFLIWYEIYFVKC